MEDYEVYNKVDPLHRWVMYKPLLSEALHYRSGPAGMPVPEPGKYIVRPAVNLYGMGAGARIMHLETGFEVPPGYFWQEVFEGRHVSVDYNYGDAVYAVEGIKEGLRFRKWVPYEDGLFILPDWLSHIIKQYECTNVEFIGGNIIEVHFRGNPDPKAPVEVIWEDEFIPAFEDCDTWINTPRVGFKKIK